MARPKLTSSRSTPRPSTRSQQHSPPRSKPSVVISIKNPSTAASSSRGDTSDNDDDSVCSSSKSSDVPPRSSTAKGKAKDDLGAVKAPWRHEDELDYFRPHDWSEDKIISQLRSLVYSVAPPVVGKQPFIEITLYLDGDFEKPKVVKVPRGYRVPLMFAAKFQWASLKLVLTSAQREEEWSYYKFDILHLSRLCERFFIEAQVACSKGIVDIPATKAKVPEFQFDPGAMTRKWRCATFDRALARYNKNWLICREEFLRDFYREFEDEEYAKDVLKIDWSRWALKGHKGFKLTQDELRCGIDGRMITRGLKKDDDGKWVWVDAFVIKQEEVAVAVEPIQPRPTMTEGPDKTLIPDSEDVPMGGRESPTHSQAVFSDSQTVPTSTNGQTSRELSAQLSSQAMRTPEPPATGSPPVHPLKSGESNHLSEVQSNHQNLEEQSSSELAPREKSRSPLNDAPASALSSSPPAVISEPMKGPTSNLSIPSSVPQASAQDFISSHLATPPPPFTPVSQVTPPSHLSPSPQLPILSSPILPATSQSPHSPRSISPTARSTSTPVPGNIEAASETPGSNVPSPDINMDDYDHNSICEDGQEELRATIINQSLSPTSIDSTPAPSPVVVPMSLGETTRPQAVVSNSTCGGPSEAAVPISHSKHTTPDPISRQGLGALPSPESSSNDTPKQETKLLETISSLLTLQPPLSYLRQPTPPLTNQNDSVPEPSGPDSNAKPAARSQSPAFLSPLLPPVTESRPSSPDEIPGLGGLSSRSPFTFLPEPVADTPSRTIVTSEPDLLLPTSHSSTRSPSPVASETLDGPNRNSTDSLDQPALNTAEDPLPLFNLNHTILSTKVRPETRNRHLSSPTFKSEHPLVCTNTSVAQQLAVALSPATQCQSQGQSDEDGDDSDMDFGTPVTSPVIIMSGLKLAENDVLPAPVSPYPLPNPKLGSDHFEIETPTSQEFGMVGAATSRASTPEARATRSAAVISGTVTPPPADRASSGSPMDMQSPVKDWEKEGVCRYTQIHTEAFSPPVATLPSLRLPVTNTRSATQSLTFPVSNIAPPAPTPMLQVIPSATAQILASGVSLPHVPILPLPASTLSLSTQASVPPIIATPRSAPDPPVTVPPVVQSISPHKQARLAEFGRSNLLHPQPPTLQSGVMMSRDFVRRASLQSTPRTDQEAIVTTTRHRPALQLDPYRDRVFPLGLPASQPSPHPTLHSPSPHDGDERPPHDIRRASHKRQREEDYPDEEVMATKSRKSREGLSVREGGTVVRKVVSMVRDTLTGLNDLLEIAAESEIIPSEGVRGNGSGNENEQVSETPYRKSSPVHRHTLPFSDASPPHQPQTSIELNEIAWLHNELQAMKAEMVRLKEQKTRETPAEPDVRVMRMEIESLREQVRVLKEAKAATPEAPEVRDMRDEITLLKNEMRSLQSISRPSSFGPSTPSTPNLSFRYNSHTVAQVVHPLAHLLAAEPDTAPPTPVSASTTAATQHQFDARQREPETQQMTPSDPSLSQQSEGPEKRPPASPHGSAIFDDIPLPVKSKRKARTIFSRS